MASGLCECGCGGRTSIATITSRRASRVKGEHVRFLPSHWSRLQRPVVRVEPWPIFLATRLWVRVTKTDHCWNWIGPVNWYGYGSLAAKVNGVPREIGAHRLSYILAHGPIADGLRVCHQCDNPRCVRPDHLFLGTDADNLGDCAAKGRTARLFGAENHSSKLTAEQIAEIRTLVGGQSASSIARQYGVARTTIVSIARGRSWVADGKTKAPRRKAWRSLIGAKEEA